MDKLANNKRFNKKEEVRFKSDNTQINKKSDLEEKSVDSEQNDGFGDLENLLDD